MPVQPSLRAVTILLFASVFKIEVEVPFVPGFAKLIATAEIFSVVNVEPAGEEPAT